MNDLRSDLFLSLAASEGDGGEEESEHGGRNHECGFLVFEPRLLCSPPHTSSSHLIFHS